MTGKFHQADSICATVSLFIAFAYLFFAMATLITGFKFSRKLKLKDREAWVALTGGGWMLGGNSIFTILSRLKVIIPELDNELAVEARSFVKIAKTSLYLFGACFVLMFVAMEIF